jgi:hypothetical protein
MHQSSTPQACPVREISTTGKKCDDGRSLFPVISGDDPHGAEDRALLERFEDEFNAGSLPRDGACH